MSRALIIATVALLGSTSLVHAQSATLVSGMGVTDVQFTMEALYMSRSALPNTLLGHDFGGGGTDVTTDGISSALSAAPGARFGLSGDVMGSWGFDAGAFFSGSFGRTGSFEDPGEDLYSQYTPVQTPGNLFFDNSDQAEFVRSTENSFVGGGELNTTYDLGGLKLLFGPRSIYYSSSLSTYVADDTGALHGGTGNDWVDISSNNLLLGGQLGIEGMFQANETFSFGGRATVGLYANVASLDRSYRADDAGSPFSIQSVTATSHATGLAESIELSPKVAIAIAPKLDLTFGATLLMLNGVDEPGQHYAGIGAPGGGGGLAGDPPAFHNGVNFAGLTVGVQGHF